MLASDSAAPSPQATSLAARLVELLHCTTQQIADGEHAVAYDSVSDALNVLHQMTETTPNWRAVNRWQIKPRLLPSPLPRARTVNLPSLGESL